jgi:hypothetical protein
MYAVEAPESWLEDIGRAHLRQGVARVEVDPDFAAVTGLGDDYHVFVTPEGPTSGLYVTDRTSSGFEVREQGDGAGDISFSFRVVTRRTDVRAGRLEPIERPPSGEGEPVAATADEPASPRAPAPQAPATEAKGAPAAGDREARRQPPSDWPRATVPWPPDILAGGGWGAAARRPAHDAPRRGRRLLPRWPGLTEIGGFRDHDGYDGVFLAVPGTDAHLELTSGGAHGAPAPHPESLLVLFLGVDPVPAANPYWAAHGTTFEDPDGFRVVLVPDRWKP